MTEERITVNQQRVLNPTTVQIDDDELACIGCTAIASNVLQTGIVNVAAFQLWRKTTATGEGVCATSTMA